MPPEHKAQRRHRDPAIERIRTRGLWISIIALVLTGTSLAGPLDSLELDPASKILKEGTVIVPSASADGLPGLAGADIFLSSRGFLDIHFAVQEKRELTLMLLTAEQKKQVTAGRQPKGEPLLRIPI
ncbi:MAG: hypothetical protein LC627_00315, partial [Verrucomicrobiaceae bacterium]|nr:hypothetical protein [Verrucomicrobiaceae bacterium]